MYQALQRGPFLEVARGEAPSRMAEEAQGGTYNSISPILPVYFILSPHPTNQINLTQASSLPLFQVLNPSTVSRPLPCHHQDTTDPHSQQVKPNQSPCLNPRPTRSIRSRRICPSLSNPPMLQTGTRPMPATSTSAAEASRQTSLPDQALSQASVSRPLGALTWT